MPETNHKSETQKVAEAAVTSFQRDLGPFVLAAETTRMPMVFTDARPGDPIVFVNDSFLSLTGYGRDELLGLPFNFLMAPGVEPKALADIEIASADHSEGWLENSCRRKDGGAFWAAIFISPVRDKAGEVVQYFASFVDLTRHRREEDRLRFLLDELNHRTQNTLATVQAIAGQTLRGQVDQTVIDAFEGRILALSKAHSLLGRENWHAVGLREVLEQILQPFGLNDPQAARFALDGPEVRLHPKAALTLAMVFHELATNAVKHGALSNGAPGRIDVAWQVEPQPQGGRMRLQWRESGGPPVTAPAQKGFGWRLIEGGLALELGGEVRLDYEPAGLVCSIAMPVPSTEEPLG